MVRCIGIGTGLVAVASIGVSVHVIAHITMFDFIQSKKEQNKSTMTGPNKLMVVPLPLYDACDGQVPQVTCFETIMLDLDSDFDNGYTVLEENLNVCDRIPKKGQDTNIIPTSAPLCVQSPHKFGVVVNFTDDDNARFELQQQGSTSNGYPGKRLILQSSVAVIGYYLPRSEASDALRAKDGNFGNFIWEFGASRMLNPATTRFVPVDELDAFLSDAMGTASAAPENLTISSFLIATANILNLEEERDSERDPLRQWTQISQRLNVPTAVQGIGVQAGFQKIANATDRSKEIHLFDFQRKFLQEVARHQIAETPAIGTRGDLTTRACKSNGIGQCVSMGCPSLTISRDPNLGATLQAGWDHVRQKLAYGKSWTIQRPLSQNVKVDGERTAASTCNATVIQRTVMQDGRNKLRVALFVPAITKGAAKKDKAMFLKRDPLYRFLFNIYHEHDAFFVRQSDYDPMQIKEFSKTCGVRGGSATMKEFHNAEDWISTLKESADLVVSTRIHGGMSGISAGVPTIVIPTDYRMQELVEAMRVPHVTLEQLESEDELHYSHDLAELLDKAHYTDFGEFERNRRHKISQWNEILETVGVQMDPALTDILKAPL